jgi:carboxyl-terminal processing protease
LRGHLRGDGTEESGSSAYVPADKDKDKQLIFALDFVRGKVTKADGEPPKPETPKTNTNEKPKN